MIPVVTQLRRAVKRYLAASVQLAITPKYEHTQLLEAEAELRVAKKRFEDSVARVHHAIQTANLP